jgi:hypothetical protein
MHVILALREWGGDKRVASSRPAELNSRTLSQKIILIKYDKYIT